MELPCKIIGFLGYGDNASVFKVEYEGQEAAMKIQQLHRDGMPIETRTEIEMKILTKLQGIEGISKLITRFEGIRGTYEGLGLDACGEKIEDVCLSGLLNKIRNPIFGEPFLYEFVKADMDYKLLDIIFIGPTEEQKRYKLSAEFYSKLEELTTKVHERKIAIPLDVSILVTGQKPHFVDWFSATDLDEISKNETYRKRKFEEDYWSIKNFKGIMEQAQCYS